MLKQTIKKWNQSIDSYNSNNVNEAINILSGVDPTSKILYNLGAMYVKNSNYPKAVDSFGRSVELDKYLAISYFMRGVAYHLGGDCSHAIVDYDEAIQKLRGHEHIDYKQLGLEHRLLLSDILFNKALALGKAGGSVAQQALSCMELPSDSNFKDQCRKLQDGNISSIQVRTVPLNLLFKPPKVSDGPGGGKGGSSANSSPSTSSPVSSSPPGSFTLRRATSPQPPSSLSSTSSTPSSSSPLRSSPSIPKPPPLPSKKLPSRPISMDVREEKMTFKIFYTDRRLIQITHPYTVQQLKQKIEVKFEIKLNSGITINYQSSDDQYYPIEKQSDLDYAVSYQINELHLFDGDNNSNSSSNSSSSISSNNLSKSISSTTSNGNSYSFNKSPTYSSPSLSTTTTTTTSSYNRPTPTPKFSASASTANKPPTLTRGAASKLSQSQNSTPTSPVTIPSKFGKPSTSTTSSSLPNKKFGFGAGSPEELNPNLKICVSPSGERFYINVETGETTWLK